MCSGGLLAELRKFPEPAYRFRHALIQEAIYRGLVSGERRRLHARAAWGIEEASGPRLEESAALLGHHFAMAGEVKRAVHFLEIAGDHAASAFANDEAIGSYRYALALCGRESADGASPGSGPTVKAETGVRYKLAQVLWLIGRYGEARETLRQGLQVVAGRDDLQTARLQIGLGTVELQCHAYEAALSGFASASAVLGDSPVDLEPEVLDLWVESQIGQAQVHYWRDEPDRMAAVLASLSPMFEAGAGPRRWQGEYYNTLVLLQCTERRHRVDEEILLNAKRAVEAAEGNLFPGTDRLEGLRPRHLPGVVRRPRGWRGRANDGAARRRTHRVGVHARSQSLLPQHGRPSSQ